jgi:hypothetical protein
MTDDARLTLNEDAAAAKVIDGEAMIINLHNGRYYSLDPVATLAWGLLSAGLTRSEAAARIAESLAASPEQVELDLQIFIDALRSEQLVIDRSNAPVDPPADAVRASTRYNAPELVVFTDMEELLAFDPPFPAPPRSSAGAEAS